MTPFPCNTSDVDAVLGFVEDLFVSDYHGNPAWLRRVFKDVGTLFTGGHPDFRAIDLRYHDLEHTLQATVCLAELLHGRLKARAHPVLTARHFELGVASALLHDCGYLRSRSDQGGTGAKYTFCHVLKSCAFAATYLPTLGTTDQEVETVLAAINCTGPSQEVSRVHFRHPVDRILGCALGTADYVAQMAAPDYPSKLLVLFDEFKESDDFLSIPESRRLFRSPSDLVAKTPAFWQNFVLPKLEIDFHALYRFLPAHASSHRGYLAAIERNIAALQAASSADIAEDRPLRTHSPAARA